MERPLEGLVVLDFSHALAGPFCTTLLAQYGARVYKIESPDSGDMGRGWGPPFTGEQASYFLGLNSGKRGVAVNLKQVEGVELCLRLAEHADVLIENFRIGTMERLGLGYGAVAQRNPRLVYCSITGYGQNGPSREQGAMDLILQAACGLISVTGTPEGDLVRCGHSVADITAGMFAAIGILLALRARETTGRGQFVDVAMLDSMISAMASNFANFMGSGILPKPLGTAFATIVPYRTFHTADRDIAIAVGSEKLWTVFCDAIAHPELKDNSGYQTNALRVENRGVLEPMLAEVFRQRSSSEWAERLSAVGVPCSPVRDLREVVEDPQAAVREMFPLVGPMRVTGVPVKLSDTPGSIACRAPLLGEHTAQALEELLGIDAGEVDRLASAGVIPRG